MTETDLQEVLLRGEDSRHQFKRHETNADSLAAELAAFTNSGGGKLFLGVNDDGSITGLENQDIRRLNQLLSNAASQHIRPPIHPLTENIQTAQGLIVVVTVENGLSKPYVDNLGRIWMKNGADKRHVTAREELQRMFQRSGQVYADIVPVTGSSVDDIDEKVFWSFFNRRYGEAPDLAQQSLPQALQSLGLYDGEELNLSGLLLFGKNPQRLRPAYMVKAVSFPGVFSYDSEYIDSEDIDGNLLEQYRRSLAFIKRNLHHIQGNRGFNTLGQLEIAQTAIEEILVNALIHRDYFISASIRIMVFANRVEIISPGHLPDSLSTENIRLGHTIRRNPKLTEHAVHILPYRGLGTGIARALQSYPLIEFLDEPSGNQFRVVLKRQATMREPTPQVTPQVTPEVTPEVKRLLVVLDTDLSRSEIMTALGLKDVEHFRRAYLLPALAAGLIERTIPDKPKSRFQRYRRTVR